jgi:acyl-CoA reductase-like NAD-dependent aldehyde dehydrogenase
VQTELVIDGRACAGEGEALVVVNPTTEEPLVTMHGASEAQVGSAIAAANRALATWRRTPAGERCDLLHEAANRLASLTDSIARTMTLEGGKPLVENRDEIGWCVACLHFYAELGRAGEGTVIPPVEACQVALVLKEPIGVVGCIVPWNYPLLLLFWKVAPALSAGNVVVAKPSEVTPLSTLAVVEQAFAHLPDGVFQVVTGAGSVGRQLVEHPDVHMIAFTGSTPTGQWIARTRRTP